MNYQLIILGQSKDRFEAELLEELKKHLEALGLEPDEEFEAIRVDEASRINWDGVPVAVWFGGEGAAANEESGLLQKLVAENLPIFPVVEDLKRYQDFVPQELHRINGQPWVCARIATDVLRELRLTRPQRQAFISYKRDDSLEVAGQLFDKLARRGYRVFWDTASVEPGADFQQTLWGRMADVDLLIFLDTPKALTSKWVHQELARAHDLGLGVLQLIWPNHKRTRGTEFSDFLELSTADFQKGTTAADDPLDQATLDKVCNQAERTRVLSLRARRLHVIGDLVDQAKAAGIAAVVHPAKTVELFKMNKKVADVIPFVGVPDAFSIQQHEVELAKASSPKSLILYNGLGVDPEWQGHLEWLNAHHKLPTSQADTVAPWLKNL